MSEDLLEKLEYLDGQIDEMGNDAARFILQRIKKPNLQTQSFCTTPLLIERQST